jgi:arylsulfatase A-like enzyme
MVMIISFKRLIVFVLNAIVLFGIGSCKQQEPEELPNILWLVSEDNSPFFGCYGDDFATTPNLDQLASEGVLYTHAFANAPVCAPARNTIITGMYPNSLGTQHMRSSYAMPDKVKFFPRYLREKGYYTTNCSKKDYNTVDQAEAWNESGKNAHYKNRKPGQPFFHVKNFGVSHESSIHKSIPNSKLKHDPQKVKLPPYHPDTEEMRHDWAQYYDKITKLDSQVGAILKKLEKDGLAENTIVVYYGDHGGVLARSKRYVYESGTRVPMIIRVPEKYKHLVSEKPGTKSDRLVSFVDLAPTMLSLTGIDIPEYMQGGAFLGPKKTAEPEYVHLFRGRMDERYDMVRAVRDKKYRYIRNYMPFRISGQHLNYLWKAPSIRSWEKEYLAGRCNKEQSYFWETKPVEELYDVENDPWEVNNLAENSDYSDILKRMRKENSRWVTDIYDSGFLPEAERTDMAEAKGKTIYDVLRDDKTDLPKIIESADKAIMATSNDIPVLKDMLKDSNSGIRYWGAIGLLIIGKDASAAVAELKNALSDKSANVSTVAAEALYSLGYKDEAIETWMSNLQNRNLFARCHVLNAIDCVGEESVIVKQAVAKFLEEEEHKSTRFSYDVRAALWLRDKWGRND